MNGTNKIHLNGSTMREIVQHYFNTVLFKEGQAPFVKNVTYSTSDYYFEVETNQPEERQQP